MFGAAATRQAHSRRPGDLHAAPQIGTPAGAARWPGEI